MRLEVVFKSGASVEIHAREFETNGSSVTFRWFEGQTRDKLVIFNGAEIVAVVRRS